MQQCDGVYLTEILISFSILSFVLLGFDASLLYSLKEAKSSYYASLATIQVSNLRERLAAAKDVSVDEQLIKWNKENHEILPQGRGILSSTSNIRAISIFWGKRDKEVCESNQIGQSGCLHVLF